MRWILVLGVLATATPPLVAFLYLRSTAKAASAKVSDVSGEMKRKLLRALVRRA